MVTSSTPLSKLLKTAWKHSQASIQGVLATPFNGQPIGTIITMAIGRYTDSLLKDNTMSKEIDLSKYRMIEGVNDENGNKYKVIAENWTPRTDTTIEHELNKMAATLDRIEIKLGAKPKYQPDMFKLNKLLAEKHELGYDITNTTVIENPFDTNKVFVMYRAVHCTARTAESVPFRFLELTKDTIEAYD